jgi:ATP-dependent DNA helicase RecG
VKLLVEADQRYQLTQRERITLCIIAQSEAVSAIELAGKLELRDTEALRSWLGRLPTLKLVGQSGRTKATRYFFLPQFLREVGLDALTTLTRVQPHRLRKLVLEDLERFPHSSKSEVHRKVGEEIPERTLRRALEDLIKSGDVLPEGEKRWRRYRLNDSIGQRGRTGQ